MSGCTTQFAKTPDTLDFSYDEAPLQPAVAQAYKQNTTFDTYGQLQGQLQLPRWPPTNSRLMPVSDSVNTASAPYPPVDTNEYTEFMNPREMFLSGPSNYDDELGPPLDVEAAQETALSMVREEEEEEEKEEVQEEEQQEEEEVQYRASCSSNKKKKQYNVWLILFLFALSVLVLVLIVQFFRYVYQN